VLEEAFGKLLKEITFSEEVLAWVSQALRESHRDEKKFHDEAIARLEREHKRLQDRIDAMYMDKLDGRIDAEFFDRKALEFRSEQCRLVRDREAHQTANRSYIDEAIKLLELARRAHQLFESQAASAKRKLLDFVLSNCSWQDGKLTANYRQPFDLLAVAVSANGNPTALGTPLGGNFDNWRRERDSNPR
jgi:site-specific DNA recombinase